MTQGVPGEDEMTSRADATILERILDGREPLLDLMSEYRAAIEKEVRDDIRARVEALPFVRAGGNSVNRAAVLAAISSSSATETQDGERLIGSRRSESDFAALATPTPDDRDREVCPTCDGLTFHKYGCTFGLAPIPDPEPIKNETASGYARRLELTARARDDRDREVERGKNWYGSTMERAGAAARAATPTPDDRDREVERIATVCYCRMCALLRDLDHLRAELEPLQSVLNGILSDGPVMDTLDADGPWWTPPDPTGVRLHDALIAASKAVDRAIDAGLRASGGAE